MGAPAIPQHRRAWWPWVVLPLVVTVVTVVVAAALVWQHGDGNDSAQLRASDVEPSASASPTPSTTPKPRPTPSTTKSPRPSPKASQTTTSSPRPKPTKTTKPPTHMGALDIHAVVSFAKKHHDSSKPNPYTFTGGNMCPADTNPPGDGGDDTRRDISTWGLGRYCDDTYRLLLSTDDNAPLEEFWMEADTRSGGCAGADRVAVGYIQGTGDNEKYRGDVIATPSCDASSWRWIDVAHYQSYNGNWLQLDIHGSALTSASSFRWRGYVRAVNDNHTDAVPNAGPATFKTR